MRGAFVATDNAAASRAVLLGPADDPQRVRDALAPAMQLAVYPWAITSSSARYIERSADVALFYAATCGEISSVRRLLAMPLVVLTDGDSELRAAAIDAGADDALSARFAPCELRARVSAAARKGAVRPPFPIRVDELEIDPAQRSVRRAGRRVPLTGSELAMLVALASDAGCVVRRETLELKIWGRPLSARSGNLYTLASCLRAKLEDPSSPQMLRTYRGIGYALVSAEPAGDLLLRGGLGAYASS